MTRASGPFDEFQLADYNLQEFAIDECLDPSEFLSLPKSRQWDLWLNYQAECLWVRSERSRAQLGQPPEPLDLARWRAELVRLGVRGA